MHLHMTEKSHNKVITLTLGHPVDGLNCFISEFLIPSTEIFLNSHRLHPPPSKFIESLLSKSISVASFIGKDRDQTKEIFSLSAESRKKII